MNKKQKARYSKLFSYKHKLSEKATGAEIKFAEILDKYKILYKFQKGVFTRDPMTGKKRFRILDFYITRCKVGIEIDGGYHFTEYGKRKDAYRDLELSRSRRTLTLWRFTNEEVLSESKDMLERIEYLAMVQSARIINHREKLPDLNFGVNKEVVERRKRKKVEVSPVIDGFEDQLRILNEQRIVEAFKEKWR